MYIVYLLSTKNSPVDNDSYISTAPWVNQSRSQGLNPDGHGTFAAAPNQSDIPCRFSSGWQQEDAGYRNIQETYATTCSSA